MNGTDTCSKSAGAVGDTVTFTRAIASAPTVFAHCRECGWVFYGFEKLGQILSGVNGNWIPFNAV